MPATYEPIASQTLGSAASSVTFSSIPGTYTDLVLIASGKATVGDNFVYFQYNGDTGNNYSRTQLSGNGSSGSSARGSNESAALVGAYTLNVDGNYVVASVMSYANSNVFKTALVAANYQGSTVYRVVNLWRSTAAITSLTALVAGSSQFAAGATFSLYGIKAA
jgi:hypothetical protein